MTEFMQEAVNEALNGIRCGHGGPFGAVVVKNGKIIGRGHNRVLQNNDPTCHGEIEAIRDACRNTGSHNLEGCVMYTTAEPCPMCRGAVLWANIKKVYYGCTVTDTEDIGFRDLVFYNNWDCFNNLSEECNREMCLRLFDEYKKLNHELY
ncbi:MAG: nucleoside deaminase [Ruminococcus sp.]